MSEFWTDQRAAAEREAVALTWRIAERIEGTELPPEASGTHQQRWLDQFRANVEARQLVVCQHLIAAPAQPVIVVAHRLNRILCESCTKVMLAAEYTATEDGTCDACHQFQPDGVYPTMSQHGLLILTGGLCESCRAEDAKVTDDGT